MRTRETEKALVSHSHGLLTIVMAMSGIYLGYIFRHAISVQ